MRVELAYGRTGLGVELPDGADVTVITPEYCPGLADEAAAIRAALRAPIGGLPLRDLPALRDLSADGHVAVVFSDLTRPMPNARVLPVLLAEMAEAGVRDAQVVLINALGSHRAQSQDELRGMLGEEITARYRVIQHDAWDDAQLVGVALNHLGHSVRVNRAYHEAEACILTGLIEPHFFAGFSGGPKAVLPGIADIQAIMDNHSVEQLDDPRATWAVTHGNPVWEEMSVVAQANRPSFLLNVTVNAHQQITGVFAGEMAAAYAAGCDFARAHAMQPVHGRFDVVITSNGGYPLDLNLYQSVKGMSAAARIVREGGDIILAAACWDGLPQHGAYARLLRESGTPAVLYERMRAPGFRSPDQWQALIQAKIQLHARVHVYAEGLSEADLRAAQVTPCRSIEATLAAILAENPRARIAVLPEGPQTVPYEAAP